MARRVDEMTDETGVDKLGKPVFTQIPEILLASWYKT